MAGRDTPLKRFGMALCISIVSLGLCFSIMARQTSPKRTAVAADSVLKAPAIDSVIAAGRARTISLIDKRCAGCHGGKHPRMGLNLEPAGLVDAVRDVPSRQVKSLMLVDTRAPGKSYLLKKIRGEKGIKGSRMPDGGPDLSSGEIESIESWIRFLSRSPSGPRTAPSAADSARKQ
jgi:hypothetical protein